MTQEEKDIIAQAKALREQKRLLKAQRELITLPLEIAAMNEEQEEIKNVVTKKHKGIPPIVQHIIYWGGLIGMFVLFWSC